MCIYTHTFYTVCAHRGFLTDLHLVEPCSSSTPCPPVVADKETLTEIPTKCPYCLGHGREPVKTPLESSFSFPSSNSPSLHQSGGHGIWPNAANTPPPLPKHHAPGHYPSTPRSLRYVSNPDESPTPKMSGKMLSMSARREKAGTATKKTPSRLGKMDQEDDHKVGANEDVDMMDYEEEDSMIAQVQKQKTRKKAETTKSPIQTRSMTKKMGL